MSQKKKRFEKLKNHQSDHNWTLDEMVKLLADFSFELAGGKGSHQVFISSNHDQQIVLAPHGKHLKRCYVVSVRNILLAPENEN